MDKQEIFEKYLKEVQAIAKTLEKKPDALKDILDLIDRYHTEFIEDQNYDALFLGEAAFYQKKYSIALLQYLKASKVPYSRFLSNRVAALINLEQGNKAKAKEFAEKAKKYFPDDCFVSELFKQLAESEFQEEQIPKIEISKEISEKSPDTASPPKSENAPVITEHQFKNTRENLLKIRNVHDHLLESLDFTKVEEMQSDQAGYRRYLLEEIQKVITKLKITTIDKEIQDLAGSVFDEVMGFGPIEPLLREETITDIFVNGPETIYIERRGRIEKTSLCFLDNEHIYRLVQRAASKAGRHLDLGTPYFDAQLPDGSRIHAIIPPVAIDGIKVSLRKYQFQKFNIQCLVEGGSLKENMAKFLQIAVQARLNIAICGGTGSGKTTLMNSLLASIGHGERIITIEDTPELEPSHHHTVRLLTRSPNPEGKGAVTQADLMINALRMRPDRVILGELRGSEAFNMLHAMNTGQDGSMVTLHASGAEEVVSRLINMILMARYALSADSVRQQIANALDLIVYVARLFNGSRRVMTISQISSEGDNEVKIEDIFRFDIERITSEELVGGFKQLNVTPTKRISSKLITAGLLNDYQALFDKSPLPFAEINK